MKFSTVVCYLCLIIALFIQKIHSQNHMFCKFCKKSIISKYVIFKNSSYHTGCYEKNIQLKCDYCKKIINGEYSISNNSNYHKLCYKDNILEKCNICHLPIETIYILDSWNNIYHKKHSFKLPSCESCNRLISKGTTDGGYQINGNRHICAICWDFVVMHKSEISLIYEDVRLRLNEVGILNLPKTIPITLVETKNDLKRKSKIKHGDIHGYTKYEFETLGNSKISENFYIYILSHLHEVDFRAVLAHELLHVYLFINDINVPMDITEGFCNLGSKIIYEKDKSKIAGLKLTNMYENKDPIYGKGFLKVDEILTTAGWEGVLEYLRRKSK